ncbi:hypothetical protein I7I51_05171 [Histoplasma capsulatum]|uniref:Uncharacterized protein n=1 Tax=Ajellomyces capsulatus TaxID=5037 RepID=A0A8A1M6J8_AJECA|nr:hypothetical protein I7I51_05171 [Histoplasma capsulatum]
MAIEGGNRKGIWAETEPPMATEQESVDLSICSHEKQIEVWEAQDDGTSPDVAASSTTIFDRLTGTSQRTGHLCCKSGGQLIIRVWLFGRYLCIPLSSHGSIQPSLSTINDSVWRFGRRLFLSLSYPPECRARENNDRGSDSGSYAMRSSLVSPEKKPGYNSGTTVELDPLNPGWLWLAARERQFPCRAHCQRGTCKERQMKQSCTNPGKLSHLWVPTHQKVNQHQFDPATDDFDCGIEAGIYYFRFSLSNKKSRSACQSHTFSSRAPQITMRLLQKFEQPVEHKACRLETNGCWMPSP